MDKGLNIPNLLMIRVHTDYEYDKNSKTYKEGEILVVREDFDFDRYNITNTNDSIPFEHADKKYLYTGERHVPENKAHCEQCNKEVDYKIDVYTKELSYKSEKEQIILQRAYCKNCNEKLSLQLIKDLNIDSVYDKVSKMKERLK